MSKQAAQAAPDANRQAPSVILDLRTVEASAEAAAAPAQTTANKLAAQSQNIIVMLVIAVSGGMLFGMRQVGMNSGIAQADDTVVQYTPLTVDPTRRAAQERALQGLQRMSTPIPLEPGSVTLEPFLTKAKEDAPLADDPELAKALEERRRAEAAKRAHEERTIAAKAAVSKLVLHSVLEGRTPVARIGENVVRVGDKVDELFTVVSIEGRQVVLDADGQRFILALEDRNQRPGQRGNRR
jgi:hypothetical protein